MPIKFNLYFNFSNTELSIETVVAKHRRQMQNCQCCHCQKHNNYIQNQNKHREAISSKTHLKSPQGQKLTTNRSTTMAKEVCHHPPNDITTNEAEKFNVAKEEFKKTLSTLPTFSGELYR